MFTEAGKTNWNKLVCFTKSEKLRTPEAKDLQNTIRIIGNYRINEIMNDCFQKVFSYDEHCLVKIEETTLICNTFI